MPRLALGTFLVLGCVPGCMVPVAYDVTQSSTIPLPTPTPPPSSRGVVDLYLGASTLTVAEPASDSGSSLYVPRTQLEGALSAHHSVMGWRILGGLSLGEGPSVGRTPLPRTSPPGFAGFGVDIGFFDENERFSLMVTPEVLAGFVTTAQEATPIYADGSRGASFRAGGTDMIMILGVQLSVGHWVLDWLRLLGGVGLRSSPNNLGRFVVEAQNSLLARDPAEQRGVRRCRRARVGRRRAAVSDRAPRRRRGRPLRRLAVRGWSGDVRSDRVRRLSRHVRHAPR